MGLLIEDKNFPKCMRLRGKTEIFIGPQIKQLLKDDQDFT
jgi:hypothetical protein